MGRGKASTGCARDSKTPKHLHNRQGSGVSFIH
ncbi:hypothetical protein M2298_003184 [Brevibacillus sp. 1238]|nr:hypothetical protein [Brevibacillus sp. 1238]